MEKRYSRAEKGKGQARPELPARRPPVRIPASDNDKEDLIEANKLTIIVRLTNTQVQKPTRAVIDFMSQVWNLEGRFEGRALGLDKFQIKFESEYDLLQVLEKGPYHYKRWMLLMQRWEPTISDQFPSNISFHVRIHGIPLHFWHEGTILTIGKELGQCVVKDVKDAKIWVNINGLEPLLMKMEIELPTGELTEVELEYIKIEKHCFTCFSLFHEEVACPYRPENALPPKERNLGITQRIALQRIEAEKKRHDDRRGYRRPDESRSYSRQYDDGYDHSGRNRAYDRTYSDRRAAPNSEQSILSRTARSNAANGRSKPSFQYRVVERNRPSFDSSAHQQNSVTHSGGIDLRTSIPPITERAPPSTPRADSSPKRSIKERLGVTSKNRVVSNSGSKERTSALERLSEPLAMVEQSARRPPSFESGRLQEPENRVQEDESMEQAVSEEPLSESGRIPATLRLGDGSAGAKNRRGAIPLASQSKVAGKKKTTKPIISKRIARSPLLGLVQKKSIAVRTNSSTRRKLDIDKDKNLPCDKAGTSKQSKKDGQPTTVFIPGSTRGGVDFRPHQRSLP